MSSNPTCKYSQYKLILDTFHKILCSHIVELGTRYKLPHRLGTISIRKKINTQKRRMVDFQKTKQYGITVYHNNYHSEGKFCFYHWDKDLPYGLFTFKQIYKFEPTRYNKRTLAKGIKERNTINKYLEI